MIVVGAVKVMQSVAADVVIGSGGGDRYGSGG